jgi:hypothetical protein
MYHGSPGKWSRIGWDPQSTLQEPLLYTIHRVTGKPPERIQDNIITDINADRYFNILNTVSHFNNCR